MAEKKQQFFTSVGVVKFPETTINNETYPYLFTREGLTEDDEKKWKFQLVVDPAHCAELLKELDAQHAAIKGTTFVPYKPDMAQDSNGKWTVETGKVAINFNSSFPIHTIDCMKKECHVKIGLGSRVKVRFTTSAVNKKGKVGVGRYPNMIQVIELNESMADTSGFEEAEGFTATAEKVVAKPWDENDEENVA